MEKSFNQKILVVDDEEDLVELIRFNLTKEGFGVIGALSGEEAVKTVLRDKPDLIILDLMLPGLNGYEVCRLLKNNPETTSIPIIMLTAKDTEADELRGLELGADDYITKPFSIKILIARVKNAFKKQLELSAEEKIFNFQELFIYPERREVIIEGKKISLTETEFRVLLLLSQKPNFVYNRFQIVDSTRGEDYPVTDRSVDVHIVSLRKKLGRYGTLIKTIRGVGYKMDFSDFV